MTTVVRTSGRQPQKRGSHKKDLVPAMALLGATYGWVVAVLAIIISAIVLVIS